MTILIGFLTFILVVNCLFLILLVLVQLPKKEAGAGLAFGAGATDALFGAGSGNVLTKITKYSAGIFLVLAMLLSILNIKHHSSRTGTGGIGGLLEKKAVTPSEAAPLLNSTAPAMTPAMTPADTNSATNVSFTLPSGTPETNAPAPQQQ
jgi:preprotein translocase subunit SecG